MSEEVTASAAHALLSLRTRLAEWRRERAPPLKVGLTTWLQFADLPSHLLSKLHPKLTEPQITTYIFSHGRF